MIALAVEYEQILSRVGEENAAQAKKELMASDSYRHAQTYAELCSQLPGPMGFLLRRSTTKEQGDKELTAANARHPEVAAILTGPQDPEISQVQRRKAMQEVSADYLHTDLANAAYGLLTRIGKLQRYETSFGFYPKGGFNGKAYSAAQPQNGCRVPGQLGPDFGFPYSVEKSMTVTSDKINRMR